MRIQKLIPMAQGYMKLDCIPDHIGAHWRTVVKVTDEDGITHWEDIESGHVFEPDDAEALWTDMETNIQYQSVTLAPLWFETGRDVMYVVEFDNSIPLPVPLYEYPNLDTLPDDERSIIYWIDYSRSGIQDPFLLRFLDIEDKEPLETEPKKYMVGVWGTNSYRTTISTYHDDNSDESEIP